jgi:thioredoxin-dependent peroxiredoxin
MGLLTWLGLATSAKPLEIGDPAPDLSAHDETGHEIHLADFYHQGYTLIYFFPKADTPGCTAQACSLRDDYESLTQLHVRVLGVSADSAATLRRFKARHHLPFVLLPDEDRRLSQAFGVPTILGMTHRQTFLIHGGRLVWRDLRASTKWQAQDVLKAVRELSGGSA